MARAALLCNGPNDTLACSGAMDDMPDPSHELKIVRNYVREAVKTYGCSVKIRRPS